MSDKFDRLHGIEKAAVESVLTRSRVLAAKIANELRNKRPEHFVDERSLADIYYSLEHIAHALGRGEVARADLDGEVAQACHVAQARAGGLKDRVLVNLAASPSLGRGGRRRRCQTGGADTEPSTQHC